MSSIFANESVMTTFNTDDRLQKKYDITPFSYIQIFIYDCNLMDNFFFPLQSDEEEKKEKCAGNSKNIIFLPCKHVGFSLLLCFG